MSDTTACVYIVRFPDCDKIGNTLTSKFASRMNRLGIAHRQNPIPVVVITVASKQAAEQLEDEMQWGFGKPSNGHDPQFQWENAYIRRELFDTQTLDRWIQDPKWWGDIQSLLQNLLPSKKPDGVIERRHPISMLALRLMDDQKVDEIIETDLRDRASIQLGITKKQADPSAHQSAAAIRTLRNLYGLKRKPHPRPSRWTRVIPKYGNKCWDPNAS